MFRLFLYQGYRVKVSHADLVLFVDDKEHTISAITYHSIRDFSLYKDYYIIGKV